MMRYGWLAAAVAMMFAVPARATTFNLFEIEPNNTAETAQILPIMTGDAIRMAGSLEGDGFGSVDFFAFNVDNAACPATQPECTMFTVVTMGGGLPLLSLFDPMGLNRAAPFATAAQISNMTNGRWTIALRRSPEATGRDYVFGAVLSFNAVPEPAGWMMMILGLGAVGAAARRRVHPVSA